MVSARVLIQNLCVKAPDQAEYRNSVGKVGIMLIQYNCKLLMQLNLLYMYICRKQVVDSQGDGRE